MWGSIRINSSNNALYGCFYQRSVKSGAKNISIAKRYERVELPEGTTVWAAWANASRMMMLLWQTQSVRLRPSSPGKAAAAQPLLKGRQLGPCLHQVDSVASSSKSSTPRGSGSHRVTVRVRGFRMRNNAQTHSAWSSCHCRRSEWISWRSA